MEDQSKTKQELIDDLDSLRHRIQELEQLDLDRKQAENLLRQEHELYLDLVNNQPAGIYRIRVFPREHWQQDAWINPRHAPYAVDLASNRFCEILGINRQVFENNPGIVEELIYIEDKADFARRNEEANAKIVPFQWEGRLLIGGEILWVHFESIPRLIENGVVLWTGILSDVTERKRAEKTLQLITDNMSDMIRVTDSQGVVLYVSPSHIKVLGYKLEERVGKSVFDIVHPDDVEHMINVFSEGIVNKKPAKVEYRIKHAEGHYVWLETIGDTVMNDKGEVTTVIMSSRDITDRKQIEETLRKSQEQLRDAHRLAHIGVWNWIADTDTVTWTEELYRIAGLDPMLPAPTYTEQSNIYVPESWNRLKVAVEKALETGEHYQLELQLIRPDGATRWVNAYGGATYDDHGRVTGLQGTVQDITERKQAEVALRESEEKYRNIFNDAILGIYQTTPDGRFLSANPALARMYGSDTPEELINSVTDLATQSYINPEDRKIFKRILLREGVVEKFETRLRKKGGEIVWVSINAHTVKDEQGNITHYDGTIEDITERKRAEEALRESEEKYRLLVETANEGIWVIDGERISTFVNPQMAKLLGYAPDEMIGKHITFFMFPEDLPAYEARMKMRLKGAGGQYEQKFRHKNGHPVWCIVSAQSRMDEKGTFLGSFAMLTNIAERKKSEELLKKTEKELSLIFDTTPSLIWQKDLEGKYLQVNKAYCDTIGLSTDSILGKTDYDLFPKDIADKYVNHDRKVLDTGMSEFGIEEHHQKPSGEYGWSCTDKMAYYDDNGNISGTIGFATDITERKQIEKTLREGEYRFRAFMDNSPAIAWAKDEQGRHVYLNRTYERRFGVRLDDWLGKTDFELWPPDIADVFRKNDQAVLATGHPIEIEEQTPNADGSLCTWWNYKFSFQDVSGRRYIGGMGLDITERKRAEEERRSLQERLQRAAKMESLGLLAGGVAHDLNNALGILVGYSELLYDGFDESDPMREDVRHIMMGGERAAAIVQDMLTIARRGVQTKTVINLNKTVMEYLKSPEYLKLTSFHPAIRIKTELDEELLKVLGSAVHLSKALMNLVSNAAEAMPSGGDMVIKTESRYLDRPFSGYDKIEEGDYIVLSVSDTGEGITDDDMKRIFEPFYTKKVMGRSGTGLGLSVVWGTVKDHKGYIDVRSGRGKGTTFALYFPVTYEEMEEDKVTLPDEYMGRGEKILVVDDINVQRDLASRMLTKLNYQVETVASGEAAVEYLKTKEADLIVLDMLMDPGIDGFETYRQISEFRPQTKAVIVSGFAETDRVKMAQSLGAGAFVKKPYIKERIGLAVRKELDRK